VAEAGIPPILRRPTGKPFWVWGAIGPTMNLEGGGAAGKLPVEFGYHFSGKSWGPALAIDLAPWFRSGAGGVEIFPKFLWDIPIVDGLGLYLSPSIGVGFVYGSFGGFGSTAGGTVQLGFEGKLTLGGQGFVSFRPFGIDILFGSGGATANWDLLFGGGFMF
jgi:hypothetical protein